MKIINFSLNPGDDNEDIANLKAALQLLIEKQRITVSDVPVFINQLTTESGYKDTTKNAVSIFQQSQQLPATGVVDEPTATALNKELTKLGALDQGTNGQHSIGGYIYMDYGIPANNVKLRLYTKGFGGNDTAVADVNTDERGKYTLAYNPATVANANFEVRAVDAAGKEHPLSGTLFNSDKASSISNLNLIAPADVQQVSESEFTRLSKDITNVIGDLTKLNEAQEKDDRQDITFLSQTTNWDARPIALASLAGKLSQATSLTQEAAYALVRAGLPTDADQLAQVNTDDVDKALDLATKNGIVTLDDNQRKAAIATFQTFANTARLGTKDFSSLSSYSDLLSNQGLTASEQQAFASAYFAPRKDASELWQKVKDAGIADDKIQALKLQGKLGFLTVNNAQLSQDLQGVVGTADNLSKLVEEGLYEPDAWDARLKTLSGTNDDNSEALEKLIPPAYTGGTIAERKHAYNTDMAAKIRTAFPEKVLRNRIETGKLVLGDDAIQTGVSSFLTKAEGLGYKLGNTHLDTFVAANETALFNGASVEQKSSAVEGVKLLNRIHQVTPNDESMQVLFELGHKSAQDVLMVAKEDFLDRFGKVYSNKYKVGIDEGIRVGKLIYNKSHQVTIATYSFYTATQSMQQTPPVYAIAGTPERQAEDKNKLAESIKGSPNMQELFGSLDFCECEHCRSVLSPAAYLVDLLQFIDRKETDWQYFLDKWKADHAGDEYTAKYSKPYDALIDRRPDLINLPLTCENTNTALPYIDIVNEILEYYLVNKKLAPEVAHDTAGATTPELLAEPQNVEPAAYGILKKAKYSLNLPFDLWIETVREFCNQYDIPLWQVINALQPVKSTGFDTQRKIAVESLNISPDEFAILSNQDPLPDLFELYGYANEADMVAGLRSAKQLSNRLGVTYKELFKLIQTEFINPQFRELVLLQKMSVTVNHVLRFKKTAGFEAFKEEEQKAFEEKQENIKARFGVDAKAEIEKGFTNGVFNQVLLLNDTDAGCNFDETKVGYADRDALKFDWLKFNLFVRIWRKSGWAMEEVDEALNIFLPKNLTTIFNDPAQPEADRAKALGQAVASALINMSYLKQLAAQTNVGKQAFIKLSTLWADIPSTSKNSLYAQLFLTRNVLKIDEIFDDPLGQYLSKDVNIKEDKKDHSIALQAALNLTASDIEDILKDDSQTIATAKLSLANVSLLYRHGLLAKALQLSVPELISLKQLSRLNPFTPLSLDALTASGDDHFLNQTLKFIEWATKVKASGFKLEDINYLFRHQFDTTGKYRTLNDIAKAAIKSLSDEINRIKTEHAVPSNPADANDLTSFAAFTDDILQQKLSLIIPFNKVQLFMAMWNKQQPEDWELVKDFLQPFLTLEKFTSLFVPDAPDATDEIKEKNFLTKRATLAQALLPFIQQKLISNSVIQVLATATGADAGRVQWLISDAAHLNDPSQPAVSFAQTFALANDPSKTVSTQKAYILLNKSIQLAEGFKLTDKELQYFVTNATDFDDFKLSLMPVADDNSLANVQALFKSFIRLCDYVLLRKNLAGGSDDLIDVFSNSRRHYDNAADNSATLLQHLNILHQQIANLSRRDAGTIKAVADALNIETISEVVDGKVLVRAPTFADERGITKLWDALRIVQTFGLPVKTLSEATEIISTGLSEEEYQAVAENLKNAVKARYELEAWQQIAQPVFDKLRQRRRDALVAYLLHNFRDLFSSMEEMYEYFLVDPGTEPVVQTSRIRIATATVQLFIQRCLLNLENRYEKKVPPSAINSRHWQWMNRYRVWEANRKIFLWPENWLEPEWRDDKTFLFKELEGKLLQGDVSNDLVEDAFFTYLKKLEEIARLNIVTMYCEEDAVTPEANKLHVIGRTYAFPHKYFYRRYAQQMWTPWEPVDAEIDGNHIVSVIWRGRLHLFWVTFIEKITGSNTPNPGVSSSSNLANWNVGEALKTVTTAAHQKTIEAHLHWSEFYQGKWSTKQSSGLDNPAVDHVDIASKPADIFINVFKEPNINDQVDGAVRINMNSSGFNATFRVVNKNSPPEILRITSSPTWPFPGGSKNINRLNFSGGDLSVQYQHKIVSLNGHEQQTDSNPQTILSKIPGAFNIVPCSAPVTMGGTEFGRLITPFFYQDSWNTFYVEPAITETITVDKWDEWVAGPPVVYEPRRFDWEKIKIDPIHTWPKTVPVPNKGDPAWLNFNDDRIKVAPAQREDWTTTPGTYIKFDQRVVGKDTGMNVLLMDNKNESPVQIKDTNQLNSVINGSTARNFVLVKPDSESKIGQENLAGTISTRAVIDIKADTNLIGGAGVATTREVISSTHMGGIFAEKFSLIKMNGF